MGIGADWNSAYLDCSTVLMAAGNLTSAMADMTLDPKLPRMQELALSTAYVGLLRWDELKRCSQQQGRSWPWAATKQATYDHFAHWYRTLGLGTHALNEGNHGLPWLCNTTKTIDPAAGCKAADAEPIV